LAKQLIHILYRKQFFFKILSMKLNMTLFRVKYHMLIRNADVILESIIFKHILFIKQA